MPRRRKPMSRWRYARRVMWSLAGFFALGYFPTILLLNPVASIALAACLVIPYGSKSPTVRVGAFRGAVLGGVTGLSASLAIAALVIHAASSRAASQPASAPASTPASAAVSAPASVPATGAAPSTSQPAAPTTRPRAKIDLADVGLRLVAGTAILCAAVAALFAYTAQKRRQRIEDEWRR